MVISRYLKYSSALKYEVARFGGGNRSDETVSTTTVYRLSSFTSRGKVISWPTNAWKLRNNKFEKNLLTKKSNFL